MVCDSIKDCDGGEDESKYKCSDKKRMLLFFVCGWEINSFSTNVPLLYSLFRGDRSGTLVENGLIGT